MYFRLLSYLVLAEAKLAAVQVKYGEQREVEHMLADYQHFVHDQRLFDQFDATYRHCKQRADAYKQQQSTGNISFQQHHSSSQKYSFYHQKAASNKCDVMS